MRYPSYSVACRHALICILLGSLGQPVLAQTVRSSRQTPPETDQTIDLTLDPIPLKVESLGLSMHPPAAANVSAQRANDKVSVSLTEPIANPRWSMTLQLLSSTLQNPTAKAQVQDHLDSLASRGAQFEVISNKSVTINTIDGQLCYLRQTTTAGQQYIAGWLILPAGRQSFLVASSLVMPDVFEEFLPTLEASMHTIEITSQEELSLRIRAQIESGREVLESITPEKIQSIAENTAPQWRRIYRPSDSAVPDQEIGYMVLNVFAGKRGLLTPSRHEIDYDAAEHEVGLIVRANVRVLEARDVRDVEMLYWMSFDQAEEGFSVRATRKQGEASASEAISGVRTRPTTGDPIPLLTVITMGEFTRAREPVQWNVPDVYLSQALNWILPRVLPRDGAQHTYSYYFFDMSIANPSLQRRIDLWKPADTGAEQWQLTSTVGNNDKSIVSIYDPAGQLIRREHPDGSRTEPVDLIELRRIWVSKNLPLNAEDLQKRK